MLVGLSRSYAQTSQDAASLPNKINCPRSTNCVNSLPGSGLAPLPLNGPPAHAWQHLIEVLAHDPQLQITQKGEHQIDVVATTWLGFKDDVRFVLDAQTKQIHFRSMSRVGRYDFGKNASRMRDIAARFAPAATTR